MKKVFGVQAKTDSRTLTGCFITLAVLAVYHIFQYMSAEVDSSSTATQQIQQDDHRDERKDLFSGVGMKTHGSNWTIWDRSSILTHHSTSCIRTPFLPANSHLSPTRQNRIDVSMCTYPIEQDITVSRTIVEMGRWVDCDCLSLMWNNEVRHVAPSKMPIYLEIGANIGSCVMEMLMSTDAKIIAFEPEPHNLAQITTTLMGLPKSFRDRVALYPLALGAKKGSSTLYQATNNRGNTVVGTQVYDHEGQQFLEPTPIHIETLDDLFINDIAHHVKYADWFVPLMKLDAQGFECEIIRGATQLLRRVNVIKTEIEEKFLTGQNCSGAGFEEQLLNLNFNLAAMERLEAVFRNKNEIGKIS